MAGRARKKPDLELKAVDAVKRDLADIAKRDKALSESALAVLALAMARELDSANNSATSKSMCAKQLREAIDRLRELAPEPEKKDDIDDLSRRRRDRRAGRPAA